MRLDLQIFMILGTVLTGMAAALLFDLYRIVRHPWDASGWLGDIADALFWLVLGALLWLGVFLTNWGQLRLYVLVALAVGAGLYFWLASPVILETGLFFRRLLTRLILWLGYPLRRVIGHLHRLGKKP